MALARENGLRVEEPTVLNDLFSLMVHLKPAPVAAHHRPNPELLARCTELRTLQVALCLVAFHEDFGDIEGWDEGIRVMLGTLASTS